MPGLLERAEREIRGRARDSIRSAIVLAPGGLDRHTHCALFVGDTGDGFTSPGPDGHRHSVRGLDVEPAAGHTHEISAQRCELRHERHTGCHIHARG